MGFRKLSSAIVMSRSQVFLERVVYVARYDALFQLFVSPTVGWSDEAVNRVLEMYLRCFTYDYPKKWIDWLAWAEFCYNTSFHSSLRTSPFEVVYGRTLPRFLSHSPGLSRIEAVDHALQCRDEMLTHVRARLIQAQNIMKLRHDSCHREVEFEVGDWVLLKLQPYRQVSLASSANKKLSARFFGPFKILQRIGNVAYKLELPDTVKFHALFHVSFLKRFHGSPNINPTLPPVQMEAVLP